MKTKMMLIIALFISCIAITNNIAYAVDNGTEFGVEDDIWIGGTEGTLPDPDAEIKGFTVFGATQSAYPNLPGFLAGPGNVIVNGKLAISSGAYIVGNSTFTSDTYFTGISSFTNIANMHIAGGNANQVILKDATNGALKWGDVSSLVTGDNLGNHIATMTLNMANFPIINAGSITASSFTATNALGVKASRYELADNVILSSTTEANLGGVYISTNAYIAGQVKITGGSPGANRVLTSIDATGLASWADPNTLVSGDSLGTHIATMTLNMANFPIINAGSITASSFTATNALGVKASRYELADNVILSSTTEANLGGVYISTNAYIAGQVKITGGSPGANKVLTSIDATGLASWADPNSLVSGDNLGNHIATMTITADYGISASTITVSTLTVTGSTNLGDGSANDILTVKGPNTAGTKFAIFQSGVDNVAWMRKK